MTNMVNFPGGVSRSDEELSESHLAETDQAGEAYPSDVQQPLAGRSEEQQDGDPLQNAELGLVLLGRGEFRKLPKNSDEKDAQILRELHRLGAI